MPYYGKVLTSLVSKTHPEADESDVEYKYGKIANPTVHIALNQLRRVVNSIIGDYGKPEQIVVELSRDISDSAEKRAETTKKQRENEKENSVAREEIMKISGIANPSGWDIKKYKLWKELGKDDVARRCPYCGKVISANQLFSKEIEIEHILPYSRTLLDSMGNLTVAHSTCNLAKGNRTPYEAFSGNPAGFDWTEIMGRAQNLPNGKGKLFNKDAMKPFESGENGFIERQLNDNRYISKAARDYLACICPQNNIWGVPGKATAMLRRNWGLNSILSSNGNYKTRADHRHHSIDALVIALTDRSLLQEIAVENKANMDVTKIQVPDFPFSRQRIVCLVTDMNVSHKPDHGHQGRIFLETATGLKLVRKIIPVSELKEETYKENLIADRTHVQFISTCLADSKMTFRKAVKLLLQKESEIQKTDKPETEIFEKKWVTTKEISALDDKDILNGRIFSSRLNTIIRERTEDVISDKKALAQRLLEISDELRVKRVRYLPFSQTYEQIQSVPNKWYQLDGMCFATVWKMPGEKEEYVTQFIDYHQVYQHDAGKLSEYPKPHPAAKKIMTLYKGDIIRIQPKDSERNYLAKISGFSTTQNKVDLQPIKSAESIKEWKTETNAWVSPEWDFWDHLTDGHNYKAVNVLFKENNVSLVKISPSGKIIF